MISVELLFRYVNNNLAGHQGGGYDDVDQFNRALIVAQEILFDFYYRGSRDGINANRLRTFTVGPILANVAARNVVLPDDFRALQAMEFSYVDTETTVLQNGPIRVVTPDQLVELKRDAILAPSIDNNVVYAVETDGTYRIEPELARVDLYYYRNPVRPNLALTYTVTDEEVLDEDNTVNLEWGEAETDNFLTLLAFQKGVSDRESALVQYAQARVGATQTVL